MNTAGPRLRQVLPGALAASVLFHAAVRLSRPLSAGLGLYGSAALLAALAIALVLHEVYDGSHARSTGTGPRPGALPTGGLAVGALPLGVLALGALAALRGHHADLLAAGLAGLAWRRSPSWRVGLQAVAVTLGVHAIWFRLTLEPTPYTALQRFAGWTGDPNDAAVVALLALTPSLWRVTSNSTPGLAPASPVGWSHAGLGPEGSTGWARAGSGTAGLGPAALVGADVLALLLGATAVALTQSRLALSLLAVLVAIRLALALRTRPRLALAGVGLAATGVALLPGRFWFRFFRLLEGRDLGMRERMLDAAVEGFRQNPWTGAGVGRFPELAEGLAPHSAILEAMGEGGVLQLALLAVGAAAVLVATRRAPPDARALCALALLVAAIAPIDARFLALCVAIGLAAGNSAPLSAYTGGGQRSAAPAAPSEEPPPQ